MSKYIKLAQNILMKLYEENAWNSTAVYLNLGNYPTAEGVANR